MDSDKNYIFEADENDPGLAGVRRIYIADNKGRVYKVVDLSSGKFSFKLLEADKQTLGEFTLDDPSLRLADSKKVVIKNWLFQQRSPSHPVRLKLNVSVV